MICFSDESHETPKKECEQLPNMSWFLGKWTSALNEFREGNLICQASQARLKWWYLHVSNFPKILQTLFLSNWQLSHRFAACLWLSVLMSSLFAVKALFQIGPCLRQRRAPWDQPPGTATKNESGLAWISEVAPCVTCRLLNSSTERPPRVSKISFDSFELFLFP